MLFAPPVTKFLINDLTSFLLDFNGLSRKLSIYPVRDFGPIAVALGVLLSLLELLGLELLSSGLQYRFPAPENPPIEFLGDEIAE